MFPLIDLPDPERQAMRLDGELYRLAEDYLPISVPDVPAARAAATLTHFSRRLIASRRTAAWIWGARSTAPHVGEFLVDLKARWRPPPADGLDVVESVIRMGDVATLGEFLVTTPLRTALDLARFRSDFDGADAESIAALAGSGGFTLTNALDAMDRGRNLWGKELAAQRLALALDQPELTRYTS